MLNDSTISSFGIHNENCKADISFCNCDIYVKLSVVSHSMNSLNYNFSKKNNVNSTLYDLTVFGLHTSNNN